MKLRLGLLQLGDWVGTVACRKYFAHAPAGIEIQLACREIAVGASRARRVSFFVGVIYETCAMRKLDSKWVNFSCRSLRN